MAVEKGSCTVTSPLPQVVTYIYGSILFVFLLVLSIIGYRDSDYLNFGLFKQSPKKFVKLWFKATWSKKRCYMPAITHIMDQVTDAGVIIEFYLLSRKEYNLNNTNFDYCNGVNTLYLFIASIFFFILYRIVTSAVIWDRTKSIWQTSIQLMDFLIFQSIYVGYILNGETASNPQRV